MKSLKKWRNTISYQKLNITRRTRIELLIFHNQFLPSSILSVLYSKLSTKPDIPIMISDICSFLLCQMGSQPITALYLLSVVMVEERSGHVYNSDISCNKMFWPPSGCGLECNPQYAFWNILKLGILSNSEKVCGLVQWR